MLKIVIILAVILAMIAVSLTPFTLLAGEPSTLVSRYIAIAIQGDLSKASGLFQEETFDDGVSSAALQEQFQQRFLSTQARPEDFSGAGFMDGITLAYKEYWKSALLGASRHEDQLETLETRLAAVLRRFYGIPTEGATVYEGLHDAFRSRGIHFLDSPAPPLRDLFLWQSEKPRQYTVQLTDERLVLNVRFMDEFLLQGWKEYASLGLATTTGWVEDNTLYCIAWAYDTESENFEVSYLKHEARHLVDLAQYPDMESTELEYRAKLTELAFANRSLKRVLDDFTEKAAQNPDSPHAMANWRIVRDIHWALYGEELPENFVEWGHLDTGKVNRLARQLLVLNTQTHQAVGS